jgi:hypothetical protein
MKKRNALASIMLVLVIAILGFLGYARFYPLYQEKFGTLEETLDGSAVHAKDEKTDAATRSKRSSTAADDRAENVATGKELGKDDPQLEKKMADIEKKIRDKQAEIVEADRRHRELLRPLPQKPIFDWELPSTQAEKEKQVQAQIERKKQRDEVGQLLRKLKLELQALLREKSDVQRGK